MIRRYLVGGAWKAKGRPDVAPGTAPGGGGEAAFTHGEQLPAALAAGQIGLKPGVTRTASGPFVPVSGATYENLTITGDMTDINVGCTFINCQFLGGDTGIGVVWCNQNAGDKTVNGPHVRFEYCQFDGRNSADMCVRGYNADLYRCEFKGALKDIHINDYITATECIGVQHWHPATTAHRQAVLRNSGTGLTLTRCYFVYEQDPNNDADAAYVTGCIAVFNQPDCYGFTCKDCYIDGGDGGYALNAGGTTNTQNSIVTGNKFGRSVNRYSGYAGPVNTIWVGSPGSVFSGNVWGPLGPSNQAGDPAEGTLISGQTS